MEYFSQRDMLLGCVFRKKWYRRFQAETRAWKLLLGYLNPGQRESLVALGYFDMHGSRANKYRVTAFHASHNVSRIEKGYLGTEMMITGMFCAVPEEKHTPFGDDLLTLATMLATDERDFCEQSNRWSCHVSMKRRFDRCGPWNSRNGGFSPQPLYEAAGSFPGLQEKVYRR